MINDNYCSTYLDEFMVSSSNMSFTNDLNTIELLDEIENIYFLCDRLNKRLNQITCYIDEVKQTWIGKRNAVDLDANVSPIIIQKAVKCNRVLLHVAEKLAVVELQTESLNTLHITPNDIKSLKNEKSQVPLAVCPQTPAIHHASMRTVPTHTPITKTEPIGHGLRLQQDTFPSTTRPLNLGANSSINTLAARNTATLLSETVPMKPSIEQQQKSAFRRPTSIQQIKLSPHPLSSKTVSNGYQKMISHPTDSHSCNTTDETNTIDSKVRVKMQVIPSGTIWRHADIPIVDHPSAFFASNQDPRVAEQFNLMSIEMNNYYSKPANTTMPLQNISIGDFCVARFSEDQLWYRARVVLNNNESVLVVYIDYGNSESKPPNEIYPLIESLTRLPAMTVACTLNEVFPSNENFWTSEATDAFNMIVKNRIVEIHFQESVGEQWPLHFVKVILDGQPIAQHTKLAQYITYVRNEQIALHFNDKLTPMEYILYNVAVVESDIYNNSLP
ncbi:unnamed protein product [Rotaria magnacalcarata]